MGALMAGRPLGSIESKVIRSLAIGDGVMVPLVVALVIGLGRSKYKSRKEQRD
jgi:hypothetical protein